VAAETPDTVVAAARAMAATDNIRVNHDLVEIAAAVPAPAAASSELVPQVVAALGSQYGILIPQRIGALLTHLCAGGQINAALDLTAAVLTAAVAGYGPGATVHGYGYGVVLRDHVPAVVAAAGSPALILLCAALDDIVRRDLLHVHGDAAEDGSPIWRPSIDSSGPRPDTDLRHSLTDAVRDAASSLAGGGGTRVAAVVAVLESQPRTIFRRIALRLLAHFPAQVPDLAAERLTDAALSSDWRLELEYLRLARAGAAGLDPAHLRRLLTLIDGGPPPIRSADAGPDDNEADPWARERAARCLRIWSLMSGWV
jgi:hypothetical protein